MVKKGYVPDRGDIVWLNFNPQTGHEQKGKRPAIVVSPKEYNGKVNLGLFCPITSQEKVAVLRITWQICCCGLFTQGPAGGAGPFGCIRTGKRLECINKIVVPFLKLS
jgi:hypothetical protein